jgi:hypothetical protein
MNSILKNSQASRQGQNQTQQGPPPNCQLLHKNSKNSSDKKQQQDRCPLNRAQSLRTNSEVNFKNNQTINNRQSDNPAKMQTSTCFGNLNQQNGGGGMLKIEGKHGSEKKQGGKPLRPTSHNINNNGGHQSEKKNGSNKLKIGSH